MTTPPAGSAQARLADRLIGWRARWAGRAVFRVAAGAGWVRLHLEGAERPGVLLTALPGAADVLACEGPLPAPLAEALPPQRRHPLGELLAGARLTGVGVLPADRVAVFALERADGAPLCLLHQGFGSPGNTVLLERGGRLLWAHYRPPHALLAAWPPAGVWTAAGPAEAPLSDPAPLAEALLRPLAAATRAALRRRQRVIERLVGNLEEDLVRARQGDALRRQAEALAASLHTLTPGAAAVTVIDPRDGTPLHLELDPARSPAANLTAWFKRAGKAERGLELIRERHDRFRAEGAELAARSAELEALLARTDGPLEDLAALQAWRRDQDGLLGARAVRPGAAAPGPGSDSPSRPFRRYRIEGRWEVWVGRSNKENDELTHRAAGARDLWLHAQGVAGSHVILRTGGKPELVPPHVLQAAAALAALHSKGRHSALVPVIWTERRYVRKPRKSAPGLAVCQREKTVFVEPGVPAGVTSA